MLFVCTKQRDDGACCSASGSVELLEALKAEIQARGLAKTVRAMPSGCHDCCALGPSVVLMPDYISFQRVAPSDIGRILEAASGEPVTPLS